MQVELSPENEVLILKLTEALKAETGLKVSPTAAANLALERYFKKIVIKKTK